MNAIKTGLYVALIKDKAQAIRFFFISYGDDEARGGVMNLLPVVTGFREKQRIEWQGTTGRRSALVAAQSQVRSSWEDNIKGGFDEYVPFSHDYALYDSMRNNLPLIEACYTKYKMLIGVPEFDFGKNKQAAEVAEEFIERVRVNQFDMGLYQWIVGLVDSALHYGNGYGELVPNRGLNDVAYLKNAPSKNMRFIKTEDGNLTLGQIDQFGMKAIPFQQQDFIYHLAFWKREGHPQGYSLLYSLPFVVNLLQYVKVSLKKQWIRIGDPTFMFMIETDKEMKEVSDYTAASEVINKIGSEWKSVQQARLRGQFADVVGAPPPGSKVVLKTIGEGMVVPDVEISMRILIEEIVAQTGFPLFFFGFHWGGNYNLTTHQNDMIVNQINFIRNCIDPLLDRAFKQLFQLKGILNVDYDWQWPDVNLRDEVQQARAEQMQAQAVKLGIESRIQAMELGLLTPESFVDWLVEIGVESEKNVKILSKQKMAELFIKRYSMSKALGLLEQSRG